MKKFTYTACIILASLYSYGQCRYMEEVFPEVNVTHDIIYGKNASILEFPIYGEAILDTLFLDLYEPANDTASIRPLIIYFHAGDFLPYPLNRSVVGTRRDSSSVAWCEKLARCGYVVASADYRLGWNPQAPQDILRRIGIINAAYRGVQDARTCIRYFRKTALTDGNPYQIDESRIALFGDDTGGYLATHASALNSFDEILSDLQLYIPVGLDLYPMITESLNGDIEGKLYGINTPAHPLFPFPAGDTLCYPNHVEYSSSFNVAINLAGAIVDTTWIDYGEPPIISIQTPYDSSTPYECDEDVVLTMVGPIIEVSGAHCIALQEANLQSDGWFKIDPGTYPTDLMGDVHNVAEVRGEGLLSLYPIMGDTITDISPWVFWDRELNYGDSAAILLNPHMSKEKASLYMDSILSFILPRMYTLQRLEDLGQHECKLVSSKVVPQVEVDVSVWPTIAAEELNILSGDNTMRQIYVLDTNGKLIRQFDKIDQTEFKFSVRDIATGMYFIQILFDQQSTVTSFLIP
jgi:hypothetical protein